MCNCTPIEGCTLHRPATPPAPRDPRAALDDVGDILQNSWLSPAGRLEQIAEVLAGRARPTRAFHVECTVVFPNGVAPGRDQLDRVMKIVRRAIESANVTVPSLSVEAQSVADEIRLTVRHGKES